MADRIDWFSFPNLSDDQITLTKTALADATMVTFTLVLDPVITWWKELKFFDKNNNVLAEVSNSDNGFGPYTFSILAGNLDGAVLLISKAKTFGVHTGMYEIRDLMSQAGSHITFTWVSDTKGTFLSDLVNGIIDVVTTVANAISTTVETIFGFVANVVSFIADVFLAIPIVGRFITELANLVQTIVFGISSAIVDGLLAMVGSAPEKQLKLLIIIQRDENGNPVANQSDVLTALEFAIVTFKQQANVRLVPLGPFQYTSKFADTPTASLAFVTTESDNSDSTTLDVNCDLAGWGDDFVMPGNQFELKMSRDGFWGNTRRIAGYGAPVCVFAVRSFNDGDVGCSMGPLSNYVTVNFNDRGDSTFSTMAHELGHACTLFHVQDPMNLMIHNEPHPSFLDSGQVFLLRTSRHVTFF